MARPRKFDAAAVLEAAMDRFWSQGFEGTSVKDIMESTGLTAASLYNAYGDKRAMFRTALDSYIERSIGTRLQPHEILDPLAALRAFFEDVLHRSLASGGDRGCMVVNAALEVAPRDPEFRTLIVATLRRIEAFFLRCLEQGQQDGTINRSRSAADYARHLLGTLMGLRVLARIRPEPELLRGIVGTALGLLDPRSGLGTH